MNHTNRDTAFFFSGLTYVGGPAGRALFAIAIDLFSLFRQPPPPLLAGTGKNESDGFVIIIQNSAIDFCCKAKLTGRIETYRSYTHGASHWHQQ